MPQNHPWAAWRYSIVSKRRRKSLSAARSLLTTYLDNERRPTTQDRATYVVERVEAADGRVVSESEKSLDRPKGGRGQGQMPKTTDHGFGPDARFHRRTQMPKTTQNREGEAMNTWAVSLREENPMSNRTAQTHTPGPWYVDEHSPVVLSEFLSPDVWIAGCGSRNSSYAWANARLIAAAPDLLEAAKLAREVLEILGAADKGCHTALLDINAAITKAEGRERP